MPHSLRTFCRVPFLMLALALAPFSALAQVPAGTFTITAGNVTIPPTGSGSIPFTLTSVNGFTGSIVVGCNPPAEPVSVNIPSCGGGPVRLYNLTAGQPINSSVGLNAYGAPVPAAFGPANHPLIAFFLVLALLSGLTLRRRSARWLTLPLLLAAIIPLSSILGCASSPQGFTPGTYHYTITATQYGSTTPTVEGTNATVTIQ